MSDSDDFVVKKLVSYQSQLDSVEPQDRTKVGDDCALAPDVQQVLVENQRCLDFLDKIRQIVTNEPSREENGPLPEKIGKFQVISQLGMGGFGIVFLAKDTDNSRSVAIKIPRPEILMSDVHVRRFRNEARTAAQLDHSNILPIFDSGTEGIVPYIVMPYVSGGNLAGWRDRQSEIDIRVVAKIILQLARGIAHAHSRGILHRDIKPANVLLEPVDREVDSTGIGFVPKLTDFGLAKQDNSNEDLTRAGSNLGTTSYMAPEQVTGSSKDITAKSDVFSLSIILYELLTGRHPFRDDSSENTLRNLTNAEPVPPRRFQSSLPVDLEAICLKGLEKDPERRYRSADELADDLERFLRGRTVKARPAGAVRRIVKWSNRHPLLAIASIILTVSLCLLTGTTFIYNNRLQALLAQSELERETVRRQSFSIREQSCLADTSAAQSAWYHGDTEKAISLLSRHIPRNGEVDVRNFAWWHLWNEYENSSQLLGTHDDYVHSVAVHPAGKLAASGSRDGTICIWNVEDHRKVTSFAGQESGSVNWVTFSPSGALLVSVGDNGDVCFRETDEWQLRAQRSLDAGILKRAVFSSDDTLLAVGGIDATIRILDATTGEVVDELSGHDAEISDLVFHPERRILASSSKDGTVRLWDLRNNFSTDSQTIKIPKFENWCRCLAFSPDGSHLAAGSIMNDVFVWSIDDALTPKLIDSEKRSPNARSLCWKSSDRLFKADIYGRIHEFSLNGSNFQRTRLLTREEEVFASREFVRHSAAINSICRIPGTDAFVSGAEDRTVRLWKVRSRIDFGDRMENRKEGATWLRRYNQMEWTPSSVVVTTLEGEGGLGGLDDARHHCHLFPSIDEPARSRWEVPYTFGWALSRSGNRLLTMDHSGRISLVDSQLEDQLWEMKIPELSHPKHVRTVIKIDDAETHFLITWGNVLYLGDLNSGAILNQVECSQVLSEVIFEQGQSENLVVITGDILGHVVRRELKDGKFGEQPLKRFPSSVTSFALSSNGEKLAIGLANGLATVLRYPEMEVENEFSHLDAVMKVAFCRQNQVLVSSSVRTHFWSLNTESQLLVFPAPSVLHWESKVNDLFSRSTGPFAVSPDDKQVALILEGEMHFIDLDCPSTP